MFIILDHQIWWIDPTVYQTIKDLSEHLGEVAVGIRKKGRIVMHGPVEVLDYHEGLIPKEFSGD